MLDTTQENFETVVGNAYSGWNGFKVRYLQPSMNWLCSLCCCCVCGRASNCNIYFDMYDEDEREALEQLLQAEDGGDVYYDSDDDDFGEFIGAAQRSSRSWWQSITDWIATPSTILGRRGQQSILRYRPSTAGLTGLNTRERSSTGISTHSSDTYRSRGDLFGSEDIENDAQMMDDSFVQDMPSGDLPVKMTKTGISGAVDSSANTELRPGPAVTESSILDKTTSTSSMPET